MATFLPALLAAGVALGLADMTRSPRKQVTAHVYQAAIAFYHADIHPVTGRFTRCHYRPTCSSYSSLAVQRFGMAKGLRLTVVRLWSCRPSVVPGTLDPVPEL